LGKWIPSPLSYNLPGRAATPLGKFLCTQWLFSINSHAWSKRKKVQEPKNQRANTEEEGRRGKVEPRRWRVVVVNHFFRRFSC